MRIGVPVRKGESTWERGLVLGSFLHTFGKLLRSLFSIQEMWIWGSQFKQYLLVVPLPFITCLIQGFSLETFRVDVVTLESNPPSPLPDHF